MPQQQTDQLTETHQVLDVASMEYVDLTPDQEATRERFKAYAATVYMGAEWTRARTDLVRSGLTGAQAHETLVDAAFELIEDGWEDYRT